MLWDSGLEKLGQQWNQVWSAVEFYDAFAGPDGIYYIRASDQFF